jgi:hypothetical protein
MFVMLLLLIVGKLKCTKLGWFPVEYNLYIML